jgi:flavin-dependent dehydrogenase
MRDESVITVLGGGPAGCAAAITLKRYVPEMIVKLICMQPNAAFDIPAVGETLSPGVLPLLDYLGLAEDFVRQRHLPAGGTASVWGTDHLIERNYLFSAHGTGWHLNRSDFDVWLLEKAESAGVDCIRATAKAAVHSEQRWTIHLDSKENVTSSVVIDATGRVGWLARQKGSRPQRDDMLVANVRWYLHDQPEQCTAGALVETTPEGWWYSATLPAQRAVAMFMTDADLRSKSSWDERLAAAPVTSSRLASWHSTGQSAMRPANSQHTPITVGEGWVPAGDAAVAFDPISSLGIGFALRSGMEAARVAAAAVEGDSIAASSYATLISRIYSDYRKRLLSIYRQEDRWPESVFWKRRRTMTCSIAQNRSDENRIERGN